MSCIIVAIGGPSNSGKTQLAQLIASQYQTERVTVLCQDDFVFPENELPLINGHTNWELPDTIDFSLFESRIIEASNHHELVIVEGFLVYSKPLSLSLYDKKIFITIREETFLKRKSEDLRWGLEPDWYIRHIWDQYMLYGLPPAGEKVLMINGENARPIDRIIRFIND